MGGLRAGEAQQGPDGPYHGDNLGSTDTPFGAAQRQGVSAKESLALGSNLVTKV